MSENTESTHVRSSLDRVYWERNQLVAHLSKLYPSWITIDDDVWWIVYVETPAGQLSWHFHEDDMGNFMHLLGNPAGQYDGHTTDEKYDRLNQLPSE